MDPAKDADGLHPVNLGKLVLQEPGPVPATPAGIQAIFQHYGLEIAGEGGDCRAWADPRPAAEPRSR